MESKLIVYAQLKSELQPEYPYISYWSEYDFIITVTLYYLRSAKSFIAWGAFYQHGLTLIPVWISNHMPSKVWNEITDPFLHFTVDIWISNWIIHFVMDVITYPC